MRVIRKGDKDYQRLVDSGELWKILFRAHFNKYFMTVSSEDTVAPEKGLIGRHAYSILEVLLKDDHLTIEKKIMSSVRIGRVYFC